MANDKRRGRIIPLKANETTLATYLERRVASLKEVRREFEPLWKDIRLYLEPNYGKALLDESDRNKTAAKREDHKLLNTEPRQMLKRYAAGMQSGITNQAQQWFQFVPAQNADEVAKRDDLKLFFAKATESCSDALKSSNFYLVTEYIYAHSAQFGTAVGLALRGGNPGEIYFQVIDEGDYWIAEDKHQRVNVLLRRVEMTLSQAAEEFMESNLPECWREKLEKGNAEERVTVMNLICPRGEDEAIFADIPEYYDFASFYFVEKADKNAPSMNIIDVRGFETNPIIAYRHTYCGSVYGKGIGEEILGDLKQLQKEEEYSARIIAGEAIPPLQAPASLKGKINNFPGGTTYYDEIGGTSGRKVERLFETHNALEAIEGKIQTILSRIGRALYNDLFSAMLNISASSAKQMTAREVSEISAEKVTLLGPVLTRMDHDFLAPATDRVFDIRFEDGFIDNVPDDIFEGEVEIGTEYTSTIHSEMKANMKKRALFNVLDVTGMVAQFDQGVVAKIDADAIIDDIGALHPESGRYIRTTKKAEEIRRAQAEAAQKREQNAALLQMAMKAGDQAKKLSETQLGNGSALDQVMGVN